MAETVDVDQLWRSLGIWGKFQIRQLIVLLISIWSCSVHMLSIVFIGYRPQYLCQDFPVNVSEATNSSWLNATSQLEYGKCSIETIYNSSGVVTTGETGCTNGWHYYDSDGEFNKERSFVSEWNLVCDREQLAELSQVLVMLGQAFGAFIFTSIADRYGRKPVHIVCHVILFGIALATSFAPNYSYFAVMRMLTGAFQQGTGLAEAIIMLEMFPLEVRGYVEVLGLLMWSTGIGLVTPIAYIFRDMSWRYLQICLACVSAWSLVEWWLIDESLRWLIANGKIERAKAIIKKACKLNKKSYNEVTTVSGFKSYELQCCKEDSKSDKAQPLGEVNEMTGMSSKHTEGPAIGINTKQYTMLDLLKSKQMLLTSLIMWFAWITNSTTYYGIMLISSNLAGDRFLNFFLGSIVEYPAALMEFSMINRFGRKPAAITFHCICGVALITATILTTIANGNSAMIIGATIFTLIGKFAITGSFSTIFLYTPELYPTNMRNVGIGLSSAASRAGGMLAPFSRNLAEIALWAPGLIFGSMCAIVAISLLWVPETNQYELPQTLEECEVWYKDNKFKLPWLRKSRSITKTTNDVTIPIQANQYRRLSYVTM